MGEICGDDRFELIDKAKRKLLEDTNIESRPEEIAVIDSVLFRCWQMGWLDSLREGSTEQAISDTLSESDEGCYLMRDGKKFPVELDYGFLGILPISIIVGGFRYLLEVPNGE